MNNAARGAPPPPSKEDLKHWAKDRAALAALDSASKHHTDLLRKHEAREMAAQLAGKPPPLPPPAIAQSAARLAKARAANERQWNAGVLRAAFGKSP